GEASAVQVPDELHEPGNSALVDTSRHLVEEEHARLGGERARQLEALALAGGERARVRVRLLDEPDPVEQLAGARPRVTHVARPGERAHHHVVDDGESRERPQLLERARDTPAAHLVGGEAREGASVESHHARIGVIEAADDLEERRLAGPVRADDADQLARLHLEGEVAVRGDAAEPLGDARDGEETHDVDPATGRRLNRSPNQGTSPWGANRIITTSAGTPRDRAASSSSRTAASW